MSGAADAEAIRESLIRNNPDDLVAVFRSAAVEVQALSSMGREEYAAVCAIGDTAIAMQQTLLNHAERVIKPYRHGVGGEIFTGMPEQVRQEALLWLNLVQGTVSVWSRECVRRLKAALPPPPEAVLVVTGPGALSPLDGRRRLSM